MYNDFFFCHIVNQYGEVKNPKFVSSDEIYANIVCVDKKNQDPKKNHGNVEKDLEAYLKKNDKNWIDDKNPQNTNKSETKKVWILATMNHPEGFAPLEIKFFLTKIDKK